MATTAPGISPFSHRVVLTFAVAVLVSSAGVAFPASTVSWVVSAPDALCATLPSTVILGVVFALTVGSGPDNRLPLRPVFTAVPSTLTTADSRPSGTVTVIMPSFIGEGPLLVSSHRNTTSLAGSTDSGSAVPSDSDQVDLRRGLRVTHLVLGNAFSEVTAP